MTSQACLVGLADSARSRLDRALSSKRGQSRRLFVRSNQLLAHVDGQQDDDAATGPAGNGEFDARTV